MHETLVKFLGLGRYPGERIGYPLQYSWTSLVAQKVKDLPAMWKTWVWSLVLEDALEESMATHSSILSSLHGQRSLAGYSPWGDTRVRHNRVTKHMYSIMWFAKNKSFTSFPVWITFICFYSVIAMANTFKAMLNSSGESEHPWFFPYLRESAFSFHHWE